MTFARSTASFENAAASLTAATAAPVTFHKGNTRGIAAVNFSATAFTAAFAAFAAAFFAFRTATKRKPSRDSLTFCFPENFLKAPLLKKESVSPIPLAFTFRGLTG